MARFVIDPPVLLRIARDAMPVDPAHHLVAPNPVRSEALALLLGEVMAGRVDDREAEKLHARMTGLKIRLWGDRVSRATAWRLARERGWPDLHDAEYLAITRLQGDALIALEPGLIRRATGIVSLAGIDALLTRDV